MTWKRSVLVVANVTATSDQLLAELKRRAQKEPTSFTLVVPATPFGGGREAAAQTLEHALGRLHEAGLEVEGQIGDGDPTVAVTEAWNPRRFDEIVVSTLPMRVSKWLHAGLPERIAKLTGAPVRHVVAAPPKLPPVPAPVPTREDPSAVMGPLSVLAWGAQKPH